MLPCPACTKKLPALVRECPNCRADLSLLVDYVGGLVGGLERAERMTREGRLAEAVWAYLEVLDVDPENAVARRQISRVAAAVRHFDGREREGWSKGIWLTLALGAMLLGIALGIEIERWRVHARETNPPAKTGGGE
jgi:hypothetical protein